jgi:Uncharacterised protein family UPF0565
MGDDVSDFDDETVQTLSNPANICSVLAQKLDPDTNVFVICPKRYSGPFACFDHFIPSMTAAGEPIGYFPHKFPACSYLVDHISQDLAKDLSFTEFSGPKTGTGDYGDILLFGFSKGGIVLNQIMAELAHSVNISSQPELVKSSAKSCLQHLFPSSVSELLSSLTEFHYVDAGLNCRGCHMTDPAVLDDMAKFVAFRKRRLRVVLHGTPRQWSDRRRPWILQEKERFLLYLQLSSQTFAKGMINVEDKWYFKDVKPSLSMHFNIIRAMDVN